MSEPSVPAKFADLTIPPVAAAVHVKLEGQDCPWSMEIPLEQARDMEADGFTVHWLQPKSAITQSQAPSTQS
ncbi:hypothetical protein [Leisingera caerulea]|uniref:hypothetical protein n=1 Tax=Leisingera caerulea TaxID=506591 RepID=UPI00041D3905|nr:hypothetical protein [Leisingera caerulea]